MKSLQIKRSLFTGEIYSFANNLAVLSYAFSFIIRRFLPSELSARRLISLDA